MQKQQQQLHQQKKNFTRTVKLVKAARWALLLLPSQNRILWNNFWIMNNNLPKKGTEIPINGGFFRNGMQHKLRLKLLNERNLLLLPK